MPSMPALCVAVYACGRSAEYTRARAARSSPPPAGLLLRRPGRPGGTALAALALHEVVELLGCRLPGAASGPGDHPVEVAGRVLWQLPGVPGGVQALLALPQQLLVAGGHRREEGVHGAEHLLVRP